MKFVVMILLTLSVLIGLFAVLSGGWERASAQAPAGAAAQEAGPTAAPVSAPARTTSPVVGILVLLAPAVFLIWQKSRPNADKKRTSGACLPIINEDRPS